MKMRLAILLLALVPLAGAAQPVPDSPPVGLPIGRGAPPPPAGITVFATAQQRVAVRQVQFIAYAHGNLDEAGALAAMRAAGIDDPSVGSPGPILAPGNRALLRGTIRNASRAKLETIAAAVGSYVRDHPAVGVDSVQFFAPLVGCPELEAPVRARALAEARRRAEAIAAAAGVALDGVSAVAESGGCPAVGENVSGPQVDPTTLTTSLSVAETVTFAIVPQGGARRRPL